MEANKATGGHGSGTFDPREWLNEFERCGGWLEFDDQQAPIATWRSHSINKADEARIYEMVRELSDEQMSQISEARQAEAETFRPEIWCLEFNAVGGSVYAFEGRPWTGFPEQADARALRMRNRLIPAEEAKLRDFLRRHLKLESVH